MPQRPIQERHAVAAVAIRIATPDDGEPLAAMINDAYFASERGLFANNRTSANEIARAIEGGATVLVAETADGAFAGSIQIDLGDEAHFGVLATATNAQGRGIARALIAEAEMRAKASGFADIRIECIGEVGLQAYYERLGYAVEQADHEPAGSPRSLAWGATRPWTMLHMRKPLS